MKKTSTMFVVEIVKYETDEDDKEIIVKRSEPVLARKADKLDDGYNINLDHENYYTRIVPVP